MTHDIRILGLLFLINGTPIILQRLLGRRWSAPVDFELRLADGRPLFGPSKTWRGLAGALLMGTVASVTLGFGAETGFMAGAGAMAGDLFSSFLKRRFGMAASDQAIGLDQVPESLFPLLMLRTRWNLDDTAIFMLVIDFLVLELLLSRLLYWLHIRRQPY